jgi:hypothetical protein
VLVVGFVVDDAIVVVEGIQRDIEDGLACEQSGLVCFGRVMRQLNVEQTHSGLEGRALQT